MGSFTHNVALAMPEIHLPHLCRQTARGRVVWYVRLANGPRHRVHGQPGEDGFAARYEAALAKAQSGTAAQTARTASPRAGTIAHLVALYGDSLSLRSLAPKGQARHMAMLARLCEAIGTDPLANLTRDVIEAVMSVQTAGAAEQSRRILARFCRWAVDRDLLPTDPSAKIKPLRPVTAHGHMPWTREAVQQLRAAWPNGTRQRLALELMLNTSARRSDLVKIGRQHISRDGARILYTPSKTSDSSGVAVNVPIWPSLRAALDAMPPAATTASNSLALLTNERGQPYKSGDSFGNVWRDWTSTALGQPINCHGVRKLIAQLTVESGSAVHEVMAMLGHTSPTMATGYAKQHARAGLADTASARLNQALTPHISNKHPSQG
jgi:integrase